MSNPKQWYVRSHDFAPYTRADGVAVAEEFDAIQASFEVIPQMRSDGKGFVVSPIIPDATEDNHPATYGQLKNSEQSVMQMKQEVEQKRDEVARNTQTTATNTQTATAAKTQAVSSAQQSANSAQTASQQARAASQSASAAASSAQTANQHQQTATQQATAAAQSATHAQNAETLAQQWAANPEDNVVQNGKFSAFHYANKARQSAERVNQLAGGRKDWSEIDNIPNASTTQAGIVQLSSATNSDSETQAATPQAVKSVKDIAESKQSPATTLAGYGITDFKVETARGNLNHYTTPGLYSFNSLSTSQNRPGGFTGNLFVVSGGTGNERWCHQIFKRHYSGETYERWQTSGSNDNWSEWQLVVSQNDLNQLKVLALAGL